MDPPDVSETSIITGEYTTGVRLLVLNLPEDEGEGLGFRLTRTLWDPYPWVREVSPDSPADDAGLKMGDCILQADGKDLLGLPVGQVAGLIRGDGGGRGVSLLVWNCGVDPKEDPDLLWSCGGGTRGEHARRALSGCVRALACCVCTSTAVQARSCTRSHIYCLACYSRLDRCALCRETLPPKDSSYARNLVAEQVFEAIATEYEIRNVKKRPTETSSAYTSPNRSPSMSPAVNRRGQYQLSLMNRKKHVQFDRLNSASDPNIHRSLNQEAKRNQPSISGFSTKIVEKTTENPLTDSLEATELKNRTKSEENFYDGNSKCSCQSQMQQNKEAQKVTPQINFDSGLVIPHKVVATLRQACSMADLRNAQCLSKVANRLGECQAPGQHSSLDNLKTQCCSTCDFPVFLLSAPPIYVVACDHSKEETK